MDLREALECKVIATAGSEEKRRICVEKGKADAAIDYGKPNWQVNCASFNVSRF
jgi:NADPH-dependent curcumin reductase CurA